MSLEELLQVKVTSSTLSTKGLKTVPSAVTVFNRDQIRNLGADYLHEIINFVPGFQTYRQGESSIEYFHSARGHRSSTKSREVLVRIDGVRVNREFDNAMAIPMLSLHNVEKIEFIRGPGSALYGSNAVLGVIDISTMQNKKNLQLSVGDNDKSRLSGMGSTEINGWQLDSAFNLFEDDGEKLEVQDFFDSSITKQKDPRNGEDIQFNLQKDQTLFNISLYNREGEDFYVSEVISDSGNSIEHQHSQMRFVQGVSWRADLKSEISLIYSENVFNTNGNRGSAGFVDSEVSESNFDLKIHNQWEYRDQQRLTFGFDVRQSETSEFEFNSENSGTIIFYPEKERDISSFYVQNEHQFDTGIEMVVGARYDDYNSIGSSFSPRIGYVQPLTASQTLKLLYAEAFRAPTNNELFLENTGGVVGNPDLKPETIETWELIWIGDWESQIVSVNAFYNTFNDIIIRDDSLAPPTFVNQSKSESFYGYEIEYALEITNNWLLNLTGTVIQDLPESDFRQADRLASFIMNYGRNLWNVNISGSYSGKRQYLVGTTMEDIDSYWLFNTNWLYNLNHQTDLSLSVKNVLDEDYVTPTQGNTLAIPISNRGREFTITVEVKF